MVDRIAKNNQTWNRGDQSGGLNVGTPSLSHLMKEKKEHDQMMDTIATNLTLMTMRSTESEVKKVDAVEEEPS
ncbi:hypothetical protein HAX54_041056, partial [Datura stramonium]|nr:hypothetical protein [Datura stramonium]